MRPPISNGYLCAMSLSLDALWLWHFSGAPDPSLVLTAEPATEDRHHRACILPGWHKSWWLGASLPNASATKVRSGAVLTGDTASV